LKIGVIGLGAGTIAGYGRPGDMLRFYEINPLVRAIATREFHYLSCPAQWSVAMGDARLSLEREAPQQFDVLAVDAFTSDAIPVHLLTKEAFALYWRHLKPDGVLAVHVSNQYIELVPIVAAAARESGKGARVVRNDDDPENDIDRSVWVLVTAREDFFSAPALKPAAAVDTANAVAWTDDYSNLWRALK
jgi:spermidine synthase